ncbi:MAG: UDP-4-amino-4-deoxy-L-arabinose--oxoglutarate aminotransferase [Elusimicrobia bacterium]|nr:UDP-4-amino-4-deoxy-L-arabinose--oxoglutarate aminotransferase [Elusimicrobiota bacterium]
MLNTQSMTQKIDRVTDLEKKYVMEVLDTQFRNSLSGGMIRRFEERFAEAFGAKFAISQVNGTATLHSALIACGVTPGSEVIVPPLTMMSTTFAVLQCGAIPVYADVDPKTFTLDPQSILKCVTSRTKAIMPVSIFGLSPDMEAIMKIAAERGLKVIEDNAQCFLGKYKGRVVGKWGHMASYSFQLSKHLTSGEGGVLITDDEELAIQARRFGTLGYASIGATSGRGKVTRETIQDPKYERHVMVGWNYRMSEVTAAVALAQTERIQEFVHQRQAVAALFEKAWGGCQWLVPQQVPQDTVHSWWTYVLKMHPNASVDWYGFRKKYKDLGGDGIYACWKINYLEPVLKGQKLRDQMFTAGLCPIAESIQPALLQFKTNYMDLGVAEQKAEALAKTIEYFGR